MISLFQVLRTSMVQALLLALLLTVTWSQADAYADHMNDGQPHCVDVAKLEGYSVQSDSRVIMHMRGHHDLLMILDGACPQLSFQRYFTFVPVDGHLCPDRDSILARTGDTCKILTITSIPSSEKIPPHYMPYNTAR